MDSVGAFPDGHGLVVAEAMREGASLMEAYDAKVVLAVLLSDTHRKVRERES